MNTHEKLDSAQKAVSLRAQIADLEKRHLKEFLKKQKLESKPKPYQVDSSTSSNTGKPTLTIDTWRLAPDMEKGITPNKLLFSKVFDKLAGDVTTG